MIPKIIHLCWFSNEPFPIEIKICLASWKRILPDYTIRRWTYEDAKAIGCQFIDEALDAHKWAFAADAVRFYAVYKEGGIYMDSDILLKKRFDNFIPETGFASFNEHIHDQINLQAAFFMGEKGNLFCKDIYEYYNNRPFKRKNNSFDETISPIIMAEIAEKYGYIHEEKTQHLRNDITIYPSIYVTSSNSARTCPKHPDAFAIHTIYGSWRHRKLGRRIELWLKHQFHYLHYFLFYK